MRSQCTNDRPGRLGSGQRAFHVEGRERGADLHREPDNTALSYFTSAKMVGTDENTGKEIWAPYIAWGADHVKVTAAEAMQADAGGGGAASAKREAREFLLDRLQTGPGKADDLLEEAEQNGISQKTLRRAKHDLKIISRKEKKCQVVDGFGSSRQSQNLTYAMKASSM